MKQSQGKINILRLTCRAGASLAAFVPALGTSGGFSSSTTYDIGRVYGLIWFDLQAFWGDSGPETMERVFPLRFYGDGADTIGLNTFELISMMSVAPHRSSSLKSRFVLLQPLLSHCLLCRG